MLIRDEGSTWTAIGQPAHAWLAGQLARAWHEPLADDVVLAVEQHDVAWTELDRAPMLNATARRAAAFFELPAPVRHAAWERVVDRLLLQSPYAALLVSLHATNIHTRYGSPEQRPHAFLERQRADQDALLARLEPLGITREAAERDADILFCIDAISLALCHASDEASPTAPGLGTLQLRRSGEQQATIEPWPFAAQQVRCWLHARTLAERFDDEDALRSALDAAPWQRLEWRLRPSA